MRENVTLGANVAKTARGADTRHPKMTDSISITAERLGDWMEGGERSKNTQLKFKSERKVFLEP